MDENISEEKLTKKIDEVFEKMSKIETLRAKAK